MYDEGAHTYWYRYRDDRGQEHTVWLENADSLAHKLRRLALYNLRGVAFQHLLEDGNDDQVWQVDRGISHPDRSQLDGSVCGRVDDPGRERHRRREPDQPAQQSAPGVGRPQRWRANTP